MRSTILLKKLEGKQVWRMQRGPGSTASAPGAAKVAHRSPCCCGMGQWLHSAAPLVHCDSTQQEYLSMLLETQ